MNPEELLQQWQNKSQETVMAMREWRQAHPRATLAEIEQAVDEQITQLRASMIEEVAQASPSEQTEKEKSGQRCPQCGERMQARGKRQRKLQTQGGSTVTLTRQYHSCPFCGYSFFPPG
jgi:NADH pyrophosphatase NudC (nudix superfamily)